MRIRWEAEAGIARAVREIELAAVRMEPEVEAAAKMTWAEAMRETAAVAFDVDNSKAVNDSYRASGERRT